MNFPTHLRACSQARLLQRERESVREAPRGLLSTFHSSGLTVLMGLVASVRPSVCTGQSGVGSGLWDEGAFLSKE